MLQDLCDSQSPRVSKLFFCFCPPPTHPPHHPKCFREPGRKHVCGTRYCRQCRKFVKGTGHLCHIATIRPRKAKKRNAATAAMDGEAAEGNELLEGEGEDDPDDLEALIRQMEIDDGERPIEDEPEAAPYSIIPFDFEVSSLLCLLWSTLHFCCCSGDTAGADRREQTGSCLPTHSECSSGSQDLRHLQRASTPLALSSLRRQTTPHIQRGEHPGGLLQMALLKSKEICLGSNIANSNASVAGQCGLDRYCPQCKGL